MRNNKVCRLMGIAALGMVASGTALAGMGNLGTTYGILPSDVASAQSLSLFNTQISSLYYNPAYMVKDPHGALTGGLMYAKPQLDLDSLGGADPINRSGGNVLDNTASRQVLLGMKTDLTSLTKYQHPVYFGVMLGVEKFGSEMLAFNSQTSTKGQYFEYGREPLFLVLGGGTNLWRGIDVGASAQVTLQSSATLNASSTLAGQTSNEQMDVSAQPVLSPILGVNVDWGKTLCPDSNCWLQGFETAFSFRGHSNTKTTVNSNITIPGTVPSPGVALAVTTLDSYQPDIFSAGLLYGKDHHYRVGFTLEMQRWSSLEDQLKRDTIKDQAATSAVGHMAFRNIVIPRLGGEYWLNKSMMLTGGVAYSPTPLDSNSSLDVNYLDSNKIIVGLGLSMTYNNPPILAYPVRVDIGYQYQKLAKKNFDLYSSNSPSYPQPYETVAASGSVNVISTSITMKF